jgi:sulfate transport system ATP-binding protein
MEGSKMGIEVRDVARAFGSFQAVKNVSLEIPRGELVALLGPSGSGKTTLLRLIAGLEEVDKGQILFKGEDSAGKTVQERKVGFVFQHYALFRHMTIFDNIAFGLQVRPRKSRPSKAEIRERVYELLRLVQLEGLAERFPSQLSGGQRQRVALARALAVEPEVLLLDEPFGALDAKVRQELRRWLRSLHEKLNITTVFVTHDQEEALEMADRVVIMNEGRIEQIGTPEEVYHAPANPFVYSFLGRVNVFHGRAHQGKLQVADIEVDVPTNVDLDKMQAVGYIRPHEIEVSKQYSERTSISSLIRHIYAVGPTIRLELERKDTGDNFEVEVSIERYKELGVTIGDTLFVNLENLKVFLQQLHKKSHTKSRKIAEPHYFSAS